MHNNSKECTYYGCTHVRHQDFVVCYRHLPVLTRGVAFSLVGAVVMGVLGLQAYIFKRAEAEYATWQAWTAIGIMCVFVALSGWHLPVPPFHWLRYWWERWQGRPPQGRTQRRPSWRKCAYYGCTHVRYGQLRVCKNHARQCRSALYRLIWWAFVATLVVVDFTSDGRSWGETSFFPAKAALTFAGALAARYTLKLPLWPFDWMMWRAAEGGRRAEERRKAQRESPACVYAGCDQTKAEGERVCAGHAERLKNWKESAREVLGSLLLLTGALPTLALVHIGVHTVKEGGASPWLVTLSRIVDLGWMMLVGIFLLYLLFSAFKVMYLWPNGALDRVLVHIGVHTANTDKEE